MKVYGIQSVLTEESEAQLRQFMSQCPFDLQLPALLELGVSSTPDIRLNENAEHVVIPLHFAPGYDHRTGNGALFWEPRFFGEDTSARMEALPHVISSTVPRGSILLTRGVYAVSRRVRGYLNGKEEQQHAALQRRDPLTLTFRGEYLVEYAVADHDTASA